MNKKKIATVGISFIMLFSPKVYAEENKNFQIDNFKTTLLTTSNVLPGSDYYFLDRIMEKITNIITFDKTDIENNLINTGIERVSELYQDQSLSTEQRQELITDAGNNIKEAIDILPDAVNSSGKNKKEIIDMAYNITAVFPKLIDESLRHSDNTNLIQYSEILSKTDNNIKSLLFDITKIKIQSELYAPSDVIDELLIKPTAYSEEIKTKFKIETGKIVSKDQKINKNISEMEKENSGLINYVLKETKNDINRVMLSEEKPKAKVLLINTTIELSKKRMDQIFDLKKQQLAKITAEINKEKAVNNKVPIIKKK